MAEAQPRDPTPFPPLGPPIIGTDVPGSAPGIPQPVIVTGGQSLPPSFPLGSAGTWLPPPLVGDGGNEPFDEPVVPPGTGVSQPQPQFATGSPTSPTAASLFPSYTAAGPFQPIILTGLMQIGLGPPPFTPGTQPILISSAPSIPQLPWNPPGGNVPVNTVRPTISYDELFVGHTLSANPGTWTGATSFAYEWLRDGSPIAGAHASTYTLVQADEGEMIAVDVTAIGPGGEANAESLEVGPVGLLPPVSSGGVTLIGPFVVGTAVQLDVGEWQYNPTGYHTTWFIGDNGDNTEIPGASDQFFYVPVAGDVGDELLVSVVAVNAAGPSEPVTTGWWGPILAAAEDPETRVRVTATKTAPVTVRVTATKTVPAHKRKKR